MKSALSRRVFVGGMVAVPAALRAMALGVGSGGNARWVLLGTDNGKGIYRAAWDAATGSLGAVELAVATDRPDFLAMHPTLPVLFSVNSVTDGKGGVSSFHLDAAKGELTLLNRVSSHGDGPCYVSTSGMRAFVANYNGGSFASYSVGEDGALLDDIIGTFDCHKDAKACGVGGPVKARQEAGHLHCAVVAPEGQHVVVCDLGDDAIEVFEVPKTELLPPVRYAARAGSGPRHVAFHPNGKWMYCVHELDCTIDLYEWGVVRGKGVLKLRKESVISTLAKGVGVTGNSGCEIVVGDDGRFVYTCTRGVNEIVVYRVDEATGLLTEQQRIGCGGKTPRYIAFDPTRKWLVSCNQAGAGSVTVLAHDAATGRLGEARVFAANTPMFVSWL